MSFKGEKFEGDLIVSQKLINYANGTTSEKREYHSSTFLWQKDGDTVKIPYTVNSVLGELLLNNRSYLAFNLSYPSLELSY